MKNSYRGRADDDMMIRWRDVRDDRTDAEQQRPARREVDGPQRTTATHTIGLAHAPSTNNPAPRPAFGSRHGTTFPYSAVAPFRRDTGELDGCPRASIQPASHVQQDLDEIQHTQAKSWLPSAPGETNRTRELHGRTLSRPDDRPCMSENRTRRDLVHTTERRDALPESVGNRRASLWRAPPTADPKRNALSAPPITDVCGASHVEQVSPPSRVGSQSSVAQFQASRLSRLSQSPRLPPSSSSLSSSSSDMNVAQVTTPCLSDTAVSRHRHSKRHELTHKSSRSAPSSSRPPHEPKKRRTRVCVAPACAKLAVGHGVCIHHGGGKRCSVDGCGCRAQNKGLCWKHGGYTICELDGCDKRAKSRGMCWSHGGGTQCKTVGCEKIAVSRGCCWAHSGGKRYKRPDCQKPAAARLDDFCSEHFAASRAVSPDAAQVRA